MSSNSSWVPDESAQTLFSERCWLQGAILSFITYGINVALYFLAFHLLIHDKNVEFRKRLPMLIYITVLFVLATVFTICNAAFTQMSFIDYRDYPGGPSAYENNMFSIPIDDLGNVAFTLTNWLADAFMVWRFKVIYQESSVPLWIVIFFPCLMLAGSVALGTLFLVQVSATNPYVTNGVNFTLPYLSLSLALNILLTIAIVTRLLMLKYRIVSVLGKKYGTQYTSVASMTIESSLLYSLVSILFLVLFGIGNMVSQSLLQCLSQIQTIATLTIVYRIAQGKSWSKETAVRVLITREPESEFGSGVFASAGVTLTVAGHGENYKEYQ